MLFLNPLLLQAYKGIDFRPWLRGSLAGITPAEARQRARRARRPPARRADERRAARAARAQARRVVARRQDGAASAPGFKKELIVANVRRLEKLVRGLEWKPGATEWSGYEATTSYDEADAARKEEFVREVVHTREWGLVWDIGCNEGRHSRIAAENARYVVALDGDAAVVDRLYRSLAADGEERILPLAVDVTDPSPALGWHGLERQTLDARGKPELTLCLAVLHHVAIGANVRCRSSSPGSPSSGRRS